MLHRDQWTRYPRKAIWEQHLGTQDDPVTHDRRETSPITRLTQALGEVNTPVMMTIRMTLKRTMVPPSRRYRKIRDGETISTGVTIEDDTSLRPVRSQKTWSNPSHLRNTMDRLIPEHTTDSWERVVPTSEMEKWRGTGRYSYYHITSPIKHTTFIHNELLQMNGIGR